MTGFAKGSLATLLALLLVACGRNVGSVPFTRAGTNSATLPLAAGKVAFWTDIDVAYEGTATLGYEIELSQAGRRVATASCDALGKKSVELGWVSIERMDFHSHRGTGKMLCGATLASAGPTVVQAVLILGGHPLSATINRADLVVKQ